MVKNFAKIVFVAIFFVLSGCQTLQMDIFARNDNKTSNEVYEALKNTNTFIKDTLHVEVMKGKVYLSGYVKTIRQSDNAAEIARHVSGVKDVENNIIVKK